MRENSFAHFFEIVKAVRKGCPWDKEQTPLSLRTTFFEETCEAIDAITQEDSAHVKEELGDVLLNVVLIAYLFEEKGLFTVDETIKAINSIEDDQAAAETFKKANEELEKEDILPIRPEEVGFESAP